MTTSNQTRPRALVTGASSGIGQAFAERLAQEGCDLILVARRRDRLEALAAKLRAAAGVEVEVLVADLSKSAELRRVEERAGQDEALRMLVNNAGFGAYMPFAELDPDRAEELIQVQVVAVARLTRAVLPGMIARGKGAIINVSSRLGLSGVLTAPQMPKRATYGGTKSFINTFSQLLATELAGTGVQVQALLPGVVRTEFHQHVGTDSSRFPPEMIMSPEDLVAASLKGLELGEVICIPALDDPALLAQWEADQRSVLQHSGGSRPAARYGKPVSK
jgi:uncharacterized protein